jgi:hypothetical protein
LHILLLVFVDSCSSLPEHWCSFCKPTSAKALPFHYSFWKCGSFSCLSRSTRSANTGSTLP